MSVMNANRLLPALAAAAALALAPGLALADPGNGTGNGITNNPQVPPGQSAVDTPAPPPDVNAPPDSTLDGTPSANGNGGGEATGQPCAGCVGNADDNEPPVQVPGSADPNSGHECDSNNGIGVGNPAHTGCTTPTPPTENPPTENPPTENPPVENPPTENPLTETPAPQQPFGGGAPLTPAPQVAQADELAVTGFDVLPLGLGGLALLGAGGAAVVMARRTRRS